MVSKGYQPEDAAGLSRLLEDNKVDPEAFKDSFRLEYQVGSNIFSDMGQENNMAWKYIKPGDVGWPLTSSFFRGMFFKENKARKIAYDIYFPFVAAADKPCNQFLLEKLPFTIPLYPFSARAVRLILKGEFIAEYMMAEAMPNFGRAIQKKCYYDFQVEAFRLKLAVAAYKKDKGALPASLSDLVPEYIGSVPGKPIRYDRSRGIVYSVGVNGKDDGATAKAFIFSEEITNADSMSKEPKYYFMEQKDLVMKID